MVTATIGTGPLPNPSNTKGGKYIKGVGKVVVNEIYTQVHIHVAQMHYITSKTKRFCRKSEGCRDGIKAEKVSKQEEDCKGSYHHPMCHKQVPPSHITIPT